MPPLPPELGQAERELSDPQEGEADHPEEHPGADPAGGRLPRKTRTEAGVEPQHDDQSHLREDEVGPDEPLVVARLLELGATEVLPHLEPGESEVAGETRPPEEHDGHGVDPGQDAKSKDAHRAAARDCHAARCA